MTNIFCEKCGKIMKSFEKDGENILICSCGFESEGKILSSEKIKRKSAKGKGVVNLEPLKSGFPHLCPKCGHEESKVIEMGAPVSDESNIYLFVCNKCGYTDRQADGSGNM